MFRDLPTNLGSGRENSLQRDDERETQVRHHVVVRQAAAGDRRGQWVYLGVIGRHRRRIDVAETFGAGCPRVAGGIGLAGTGRCHRRVAVRRHFGLQQGHVLLAANFAQVTQAEARSLALLHGSATLEVGQGKRALAVTAIGGTKQGEEGRILADRQQLAITCGPARRRKISRKDSDLSYKLI